MGDSPRVIRLDSADAMRVLAHPARRVVLEQLHDEEFTATQLASRAGLTASAMSYHLRSMEQQGLVERVGHDGDGRERRWRLAYDDLQFVPATGSADERELQAEILLSTMAEDVPRLVRAWIADGHPSPGGTARSRCWLTEAEQHELVTEVQEVLARYVDRHPVRQEGMTAVNLLFLQLPER